MQVFRLVDGGFVDKMIAFDSLPDRLIKGIRTRDIAGMPRYWAKWLIENGSVRDSFKTETEELPDRKLRVHKSKVGEEPCFYVLDYKETNQDKEKWQEIANFVRRTVDTKVRLLDRLEDMARKMAPDCHAQLEIEPEDIPVIKIPSEFEEESAPEAIVQVSDEVISRTGDLVVPEPKKRGRPKKVAVEA